MRHLSALILGLGFACTGALAEPVEPRPLEKGKEGVLATFFPPQQGQRACYARTYSAEHLRKHPKQTVTDIRFRLAYNRFEPSADLPEGQQNYFFELSTKFRNRAKPVIASGECLPHGNSIGCFVECDGGGVRVGKRGDDKVLVDFADYGRIRMSESCGETDDGEETAVELEPGVDDKEFLLTKSDQADCPAYENWGSAIKLE